MDIGEDFTDMCTAAHLNLEAVRGKRRTEQLAHARAVVIYKLRQKGYKWDDIADITFKDRSTCIRAERLVRTVVNVAERIDEKT